MKQFQTAIQKHLKSYDWRALAGSCSDLTEHLFSTEEPYDLKALEGILQQLRNKRRFSMMQQISDALIQTGRHTYKIRRLYAQSLIDQDELTAAIAVLDNLIADTSNNQGADLNVLHENAEALGIMARVYKQLYLNYGNQDTRHSHGHLKKALSIYYDVYRTNPELYTWQGINTVALLTRARKDGVDVANFPNANQLASEILETIQAKYSEQRADAWDFATAAEACIALDKPVDALEWISGYSRMPYCDSFELGSTLRQLETVWQLDLQSDIGRLILPLLRAELLDREGGKFDIPNSEIREQVSQLNSVGQYKDLIKIQHEGSLEKVFGQDSYKTLKWLKTGIDRCLSIARIGEESSKGFGTGFLMKGYGLHCSLGEELVLITNSHVVSDDPAEKALMPSDTVVIFEALDPTQEFGISEVIWSSSSIELDAAILRFDEESTRRLLLLTSDMAVYPISPHLPVVDPENSQKIYIIGHPLGGTMQLSFQDNILLDHEDPKIHYRTPTDGGSSGSPVFNQQWQLVGLHHAGSSEMPCLNNKGGSYEANEGIWINAIKRKMQEEFGDCQ